ncbi:CG0192-related protein [Micromonosporaceae bacterium Da 78-11]
MALLHRAEISPTKLELLAAWLPTQVWYPGGAVPTDLDRVAACRFDDPAGQVGVEIFLVRPGDGPLLHTPMTYRDAPLDGAERWLIGTTEHSALGRRWVYDAVGDPVYVSALLTAIRTGGREAEEYFEVDGVRQTREPLMSVRGDGRLDDLGAVGVDEVEDGDPTTVVTGGFRLVVPRVLTEPSPAVDGLTLTGTWPGRAAPVTLAVLS